MVSVVKINTAHYFLLILLRKLIEFGLWADGFSKLFGLVRLIDGLMVRLIAVLVFSTAEFSYYYALELLILFEY